MPPGRGAHGSRRAKGYNVDAIEFLTDQHRETEELFEQFEQSDDAQKRGELAKEIIQDLKLHTKLEEEIFYPAVRDAIGEMEDEVKEGLEEHHAVELLLKELESMDPGHDRFEAKMTVVKEQVEHHVEEEEESLFPEARKELGEERLEELGKQLQLMAKKEKMSKEELYEKARELDIEGRSTMSDEELLEAVIQRQEG